ncbi:MAG: glycosyltransferase [Hormoscilla sp. GUM202]|nr:glycosyltransferase [Hormoscilla sp. GUM202]
MNSALDKIPVSVLIPAKNEERNIRACLDILKRADEIFVVDSQSSDRTVEIAESFDKDPDYGQVRVVQFYYNGHWPKKKNWSLENLPFRNEWVLIVDCDERITTELWDEIATAIGNPDFPDLVDYGRRSPLDGPRRSPLLLTILIQNLLYF